MSTPMRDSRRMCLRHLEGPACRSHDGGFTIIELLVVIAIIGVVAGLLLPAVQGARESARRSSCTNQLKQLGLALHNFASAHKQFPAGSQSADKKSSYSVGTWCQSGNWQNARASWTVMVLPFLEQTEMYNSASLDSQFTTSSNLPGLNGNHTLFLRPNPSFWCASDVNAKSTSNRTNYFGVQGGGPTPVCDTQGNTRVFYRDGVLIHNTQVGFHEITDGISKVFMLGETKYCLTPTGRSDGIHTGWASGSMTETYGSPFVCAAAKEQINSISGSGGSQDTLSIMTRLFGSFHPGGCSFAFADGSVAFISDAISLTTYHQLANRSDGLPVGKGW